MRSHGIFASRLSVWSAKSRRTSELWTCGNSSWLRYQQKILLSLEKLLLTLGDVTLSLMNGACQRLGSVRRREMKKKLLTIIRV
jgi:hypothetical protein